MCKGISPVNVRDTTLAIACSSEASCSNSAPLVDSQSLCEDELTQQVPWLLDAMNTASSDVNTLECLLHEAETRYKDHLASWTILRAQLRARCGRKFDRMKSHFDHVENASHCVQEAVLLFSVAAARQADAEMELGSLEELRGERDRREKEYARALDDYREAQEAFKTSHHWKGTDAMKRTAPCFTLLRQRQISMIVEQTRIEQLRERVGQVKCTYNQSLRELDQISLTVHASRRRAGGTKDSA